MSRILWAKQVFAFVQAIRQQDFYKLPGIPETIDWANALIKLGQRKYQPK
ncbi:MAG: hypothetical protein CM1200mP10_04490 [Candidatus Neomarinimicrobiota bacterium]|nr:MAG: hypothetical protein CM1200mP10_04490 [Candidatus Neomarinimicrobiota bacterium]